MWTDILPDYVTFLAKTITIVVAFLFIIGTIVSAAARNRSESVQGRLEVRKLNQVLDSYRDTLNEEMLSPVALKRYLKQQNKQAKKERKSDSDSSNKRLFFIEFKGDIQAVSAEFLSYEISAILTQLNSEDEVLVSIDSPGGAVSGYGFAASQLQRIRDADVKLTVAIDQVAASGGYLMAVVANKIIAAPFAAVGSIGVVAQIPNFHKLLKKNEVDVDVFTSGEFKRTVTLFGENTESGKEKFQNQLDQIHQQFKDLVLKYRPEIDIAQVSTGEAWLASQAIDFGLVDELTTSDAYLMKACEEGDVFKVKWLPKLSVTEKLVHRVEAVLGRWLQALSKPFGG